MRGEVLLSERVPHTCGGGNASKIAESSQGLLDYKIVVARIGQDRRL